MHEMSTWTVIDFLGGLAIVVVVSKCHKYVYGRHNVIACFYLLGPIVVWKAAQKWWYAKG